MRDSMILGEIRSEAAAQLYLDLIKKCLTRSIFPETYLPIKIRPSIRAHPIAWTMYPLITPLLAKLNIRLFRYAPFDEAARAEGRDWPAEADTMIGLKRLENLQHCITEVIRKNVPGDLIETGVWRGGASIFMRAILKVYGDQSRVVWVADSFEGLPKPDGRYQQDAGDRHWDKSHTLGISLEQVKANFSRYGLLDEQVRFLVGWFKDTLPTAPINQLAVLRLDGDMYSSTMDALQNLYHRLSLGGYTIIDDYGAIPACKQAVDDFRAEHGITEELQQIDWTAIFWEKLR
ncbi:MAG: TylF/MycF family methyltransferase [Methyloceanibacter sp.]|uniref:TylF/MycF family methyltransferase n=1 Tax=Methyloceanibacter sp. TaxID=1965321 RepID=UPI003D9BD208